MHHEINKKLFAVNEKIKKYKTIKGCFLLSPKFISVCLFILFFYYAINLVLCLELFLFYIQNLSACSHLVYPLCRDLAKLLFFPKTPLLFV